MNNAQLWECFLNHAIKEHDLNGQPRRAFEIRFSCSNRKMFDDQSLKFVFQKLISEKKVYDFSAYEAFLARLKDSLQQFHQCLPRNSDNSSDYAKRLSAKLDQWFDSWKQERGIVAEMDLEDSDWSRHLNHHLCCLDCDDQSGDPFTKMLMEEENSSFLLNVTDQEMQRWLIYRIYHRQPVIRKTKVISCTVKRSWLRDYKYFLEAIGTSLDKERLVWNEHDIVAAIQKMLSTKAITFIFYKIGVLGDDIETFFSYLHQLVHEKVLKAKNCYGVHYFFANELCPANELRSIKSTWKLQQIPPLVNIDPIFVDSWLQIKEVDDRFRNLHQTRADQERANLVRAFSSPKELLEAINVALTEREGLSNLSQYWDV